MVYFIFLHYYYRGKVIVCSKVKTLQKHLSEVRYTLENEQNQQIRFWVIIDDFDNLEGCICL